jgi:hypothetical protein
MADYVQPHWTVSALRKSISQHITHLNPLPIDAYIVSEALGEYACLAADVEKRSTLNRKSHWFSLRIMFDVASAYAHKTHTHSPQ